MVLHKSGIASVNKLLQGMNKNIQDIDEALTAFKGANLIYRNYTPAWEAVKKAHQAHLKLSEQFMALKYNVPKTSDEMREVKRKVGKAIEELTWEYDHLVRWGYVTSNIQWYPKQEVPIFVEERYENTQGREEAVVHVKNDNFWWQQGMRELPLTNPPHFDTTETAQPHVSYQGWFTEDDNLQQHVAAQEAQHKTLPPPMPWDQGYVYDKPQVLRGQPPLALVEYQDFATNPIFVQQWPKAEPQMVQLQKRDANPAPGELVPQPGCSTETTATAVPIPPQKRKNSPVPGKSQADGPKLKAKEKGRHAIAKRMKLVLSRRRQTLQKPTPLDPIEEEIESALEATKQILGDIPEGTTNKAVSKRREAIAKARELQSRIGLKLSKAAVVTRSATANVARNPHREHKETATADITNESTVNVTNVNNDKQLYHFEVAKKDDLSFNKSTLSAGGETEGQKQGGPHEIDVCAPLAAETETINEELQTMLGMKASTSGIGQIQTTATASSMSADDEQMPDIVSVQHFIELARLSPVPISLKCLDTPPILEPILDIVPKATQKKELKAALKIKSEEERQEVTRYDILFDKHLPEELRQSLYKEQIEKHGVTPNPFNQRPQDIVPSFKGRMPPCIFCGSASHWSIFCVHARNMTMTDRKVKVKNYTQTKGKLCQCCIRPGHKTKNCLANTLCEDCNTRTHCELFHRVG